MSPKSFSCGRAGSSNVALNKDPGLGLAPVATLDSMPVRAMVGKPGLGDLVDMDQSELGKVAPSEAINR